MNYHRGDVGLVKTGDMFRSRPVEEMLIAAVQKRQVLVSDIHVCFRLLMLLPPCSTAVCLNSKFSSSMEGSLTRTSGGNCHQTSTSPPSPTLSCSPRPLPQAPPDFPVTTFSSPPVTPANPPGDVVDLTPTRQSSPAKSTSRRRLTLHLSRPRPQRSPRWRLSAPYNA